MTEIKSAIEQIQTEMIKDIDIPKSAKTELANQKALHLAIRSLEAWLEVLNELEELKHDFKNNGNIHEAIAVNISIKRIKEHLAEIEGGEEYERS